jgi:hypothetical protein
MNEGPRTIPVQQDFLFVDAAQAKTSRQGRKNARSFVMQKARRERPWSTSKHAAKRATSGSTSRSPRSAVTRASSLTPSSTIPSPSLTSVQADYFASQEHTLMRAIVCPECQIFLCRPGQGMCPRCLFLKPMSSLEGVDNSLFDPFGTSSVETNASVSELLEHCECLISRSLVKRREPDMRLRCVLCFRVSEQSWLTKANTCIAVASEMAPSVIAVDFRRRSTLMRSQWFGTAVNDTGFMHSLLCTAALHLYMVGRGSIETILYHRAKAISAINAAISNSNDNTGLSDANIGAVFNLLTIEESLQVPVFTQERLEEEQPNQRAIHESGLKKMVQLRGGLMAMSSNRILQAFMLWCAPTCARIGVALAY